MAGSLEKYKKKRDPEKTGEPMDGAKKSHDPFFVIQKHDASQLHYDFRLAAGGVLKSWAVPKGPSTDPSDKRLAVRTEDHPIDYADFEGVIPEGEYGAGTVMVWDRGPYENLKENDDPSVEKQIEEGHVTVFLRGEKIQGGYALVRTDLGDSGDENWMLIKMDDDEADARRNPVSTEPDSVRTGRSLEEIAEQEDPTSFENGEDDES